MSLSKKLGLSDSLLNAVRNVMQSDNPVGYTSGDPMGHRIDEKLTSKEKMKRGLYNGKMDPVGQEDGDLDNDGDKDKSDKYLAKRRAAISKAIKGKKGKNDDDVKMNKRDDIEINPEMTEKKLTPAELKKREEIAKSIERDNPNMPMDKKMAIATATAKRVAEQLEEAVHPDHVTLHPHKTDKTKYTVGQVGRNVKGRLNPGEHVSDSEVDDLHDMGMKVKHERKPYKESVEEAKDFDQKFKDRLKFSTSKSPAVQKYLKKKVADRDAMNKANDPNAAKKGYALSATPPERAYMKARKKGMSTGQARDAMAARPAQKKRMSGKLPESVEIDEAKDMYKSAAQELKTYADKSGGMDKKDFHTAAKHIENIGRANVMNKGQHLSQLSKHLRNLDTSPREKVLSVLNKHGHDVGDYMPGVKMKKPFKEGVEENNSAPQTAAHRRAMMVGVNRSNKVKLKGFGPDQAKGNMGNPSARAALKPKAEGTDKPPFDPDPPKKQAKNSDDTTTQPMSRARQLARQAAQSVAKRRKMNELSPETHKSYQAKAYTDAARGMAKKRMGTMSPKDAYDNERKRYAGIDTSKHLNRKQHGVKPNNEAVDKEAGDIVRRADQKVIKVKNPDGSVSFRKQRPEVKVK